jgi:predicted hotdog family 3-hydroxylacyl-ACP dehydratase
MTFPEPAELLPHSGRMLLLRNVVEHDDLETTCEIDVRDSTLFRSSDGTVPVWVGIEYMAQCIAAHGGLMARKFGDPVKPGLLLGSRRVTFHAKHFSPGPMLLVSARYLRSTKGMHMFACKIWSADIDPLAEGRLNVYIPENPNDLVSMLPK